MKSKSKKNNWINDIKISDSLKSKINKLKKKRKLIFNESKDVKYHSINWFAKELKKRFKRNDAHLTSSEWAINMIDKLKEKAEQKHREEIYKAYCIDRISSDIEIEKKVGWEFENYYNQNYGK